MYLLLMAAIGIIVGVGMRLWIPSEDGWLPPILFGGFGGALGSLLGELLYLPFGTEGNVVAGLLGAFLFVAAYLAVLEGA